VLHAAAWLFSGQGRATSIRNITDSSRDERRLAIWPCHHQWRLSYFARSSIGDSMFVPWLLLRLRPRLGNPGRRYARLTSCPYGIRETIGVSQTGYPIERRSIGASRIGASGGEECLRTNRTGLPREMESTGESQTGFERRNLLVESEKIIAAVFEDESLLSNPSPLYTLFSWRHRLASG